MSLSVPSVHIRVIYPSRERMSLYGQSEKKDHNVCISLMQDREEPPDGSCLTKAVLVNCVKLA